MRKPTIEPTDSNTDTSTDHPASLCPSRRSQLCLSLHREAATKSGWLTADTGHRPALRRLTPGQGLGVGLGGEHKLTLTLEVPLVTQFSLTAVVPIPKCSVAP